MPFVHEAALAPPPLEFSTRKLLNLLPRYRRSLSKRILHDCAGKEFYVREATLRDLEGIAELEAELFGGEGVSREVLAKWFETYRHGCRLMFRRGLRSTVIGALGIWPLKEETRNAMYEGTITEEAQITPDSLQDGLEESGRPHEFWYIGSIEVASEHLRKDGMPTLVAGVISKRLLQSMQTWCQRPEVAFPLHLYAFAYTPQGRKLLEGYDFEDVTADHAEGRHLFRQVIQSREELLALLQSEIPMRCLPFLEAANCMVRKITSALLVLFVLFLSVLLLRRLIDGALSLFNLVLLLGTAVALLFVIATHIPTLKQKVRLLRGQRVAWGALLSGLLGGTELALDVFSLFFGG